MSVVLKYDHEPLNYQRQKSLDNKDLTIACNDLSENLLEQLDAFTDDDRLPIIVITFVFIIMINLEIL
ncbi:hypothetical protein OTSGILL_2883 [Orientia tsutsugamushi str. Gilliam]|uniref:Uncharacterized protein n=1 Tax=Orientia tsutsugamushi str. Gilliam TaxID=1359184 RepID=A0A0F3M4B5_ORITS|nr:hypothetical protein [Orientia tsutsugamushi]KJV50605.1 hypothetical protein OTSGILL_2883 [Orientia tsutsugamushi str. Gilliam]